jgi:hypothetical protein
VSGEKLESICQPCLRHQKITHSHSLFYHPKEEIDLFYQENWNMLVGVRRRQCFAQERKNFPATEWQL